MTETAEVVIIGSGFAGAATAYHLAQQGQRDIVVLEREATPGHHASGRNAALAFQVLGDSDEARLAVEGVRFIAAPPNGFCEEPLLRRCGSLLLAGESGLKGLHQAAQHASDLGLAGKIISKQDAAARVPVLADAPFAGAFWNPADGVVDIHALLQSYLAGARRLGARIRYREPVVAIETAGGRVSGVRTPAREISTPVIVNAAGAWAGEVGCLAGVGSRSLTPRRRHLFQTRPTVPVDPRWPFVWHNENDVYFRPESGGLLVSPCDATIHPPEEPSVDPGIVDVLFNKLRHAFPSLTEVAIVSSWACLRTFAADERFFLGPDPELDGLVWVAALGGHGMTTSPAVGRLAARAAMGETGGELTIFAPSRFLPQSPQPLAKRP